VEQELVGCKLKKPCRIHESVDSKVLTPGSANVLVGFLHRFSFDEPTGTSARLRIWRIILFWIQDNFFDAIGMDFHQSHFLCRFELRQRIPIAEALSCREVAGLVNNEALDVVEIRVGGGDLLDAEAAGDGEIERVDGEQTVLSLEFEREVVVFDFHGFHL